MCELDNQKPSTFSRGCIIKGVIFLILLLPSLGCTTLAPDDYGIKVGQGVSMPFGLSNKYVQDENGFDLGYSCSLTRTELSLWGTWAIWKQLEFDLAVGPSFDFVWSEDSCGISGDIWARLRLDLGRIEPFIMASHGFGNWWPAIGMQGSSWGFPTQIGIGSRFELDSSSWFVLEYRIYHESNGADTLGSPEPNPGYNSDMMFGGFEFRF